MIVKEMYVIVKDNSIKLFKESLHYKINAILVYITLHLDLFPDRSFAAWENSLQKF